MRSLRFLFMAALAFALSLSLSGCGEDSGTNPIDAGPHPGGSNSASIGPLGGTVSYGDVIMVFPNGALSTVEIVQLGIPQTAPNYPIPDTLAQVAYIYEASPADLPIYAPVSVAFLYDDSALDSLAETTLLLWSYDADSTALTPLQDIYIDTAQNVVTGLTDHLAYFLLTVATDALVNTPPAAPELIAPYSGMPDNALSVTLRWEDAAGADYYHVQVAEDADFLNLFYDGLGITGENIGVSGLVQNTIYYWRVRGNNEHGYGAWSEVWTFSTGGGDYPQTIEGSWELEGGEWSLSGMGDSEELSLFISGNVMISFSSDSFDIEGEHLIHKIHTWSSNLFDTTYIEPVNQVGAYSINGAILMIDYLPIQDPLIVSNAEKEYSIQDDVLTITFYFDQSYFFGSGQLTFLRI